jgi:THO complex subunit 2 N-terminus/Transcription- and export-related complex subunit
MDLIGSFELDPNRVLDLTFDVLEGTLGRSIAVTDGVDAAAAAEEDEEEEGEEITRMGPDGEVAGKAQQRQQLPRPRSRRQNRPPAMTEDVLRLVDVIRALPLTNLSSLIVFKLNNLANEDGGGGGDDDADASSTRSVATARAVALLASLGLVKLEALVTEYFDPVEEMIGNAHRILWMKEKGRVQALTRVSLSGSSGGDDPRQLELTDRLRKALHPLRKSWPLRVMLILIQWGEWDRVKTMISKSSWSDLCSLMPLQFGSALCEVARDRIAEWHAATVGTPGLNEPWHAGGADGVTASPAGTGNVHPDLTVNQVAEAVADPLSCIIQSGYIASQPDLFCMICRLLSAVLREGGKEGHHHHLTQGAYNFLQTFLVPSLSLFPSNPAISSELWAALKQLPYTTRYQFYSFWRGPGLEKAGLSSSPGGKPLPNVLSETEAGKASRYVLKRLSKDNIRDMSRQLAMVAHSNPLVVYATILGQIESYDNMVEVMVEAQRFVSPLGLDVLGYCILGRLSGMTGGINRSRLKGMTNIYLPLLEQDSINFHSLSPNPTRVAVS